MLKDRPEMARLVHKGDLIYAYASRQFGGASCGYRIDWDSSPPAGRAPSEHFYDSRSSRIRIQVSTYDGHKLEAHELWACAFFELACCNSKAERFKQLILAREGELTRDEFVWSLARIDFQEMSKVKDFYHQFWAPYWTTRGEQANPDFWFSDTPNDFETWKDSHDRFGYPYETYGPQFDRLRQLARQDEARDSIEARTRAMERRLNSKERRAELDAITRRAFEQSFQKESRRLKNERGQSYVDRVLGDWRAGAKAQRREIIFPAENFAVSAADVKFGRQQVERMLRDRPAMAQLVGKDDPLYEYVARRFGGTSCGRRIYWLTDPPSGRYRAYNFHDSNSGKSFIAIQVRSQAGEILGGEELWSCAIFELFNSVHQDQWDRQIEDVMRRRFSREEYVWEGSRLEFETSLATGRFFLTCWEPHLASKGMVADGTCWWVWGPKTFEDWKLYFKGKQYPFDVFGRQYDLAISYAKDKARYDQAMAEWHHRHGAEETAWARARDNPDAARPYKPRFTVRPGYTPGETSYSDVDDSCFRIKSR
jgi:hypothetical protein